MYKLSLRETKKYVILLKFNYFKPRNQVVIVLESNEKCIQSFLGLCIQLERFEKLKDDRNT